jgi:type IX secretion system PorP/SprF family membrane protein
MLKYINLVFSLLFLSYSAKAQDPQLAHSTGTGVYNNPAMTGAFNAPSFHSAYRNQWPGIDGTYVTYFGAVDGYVEQLHGGVGLAYAADIAGEGTLTTQSIGVSYAYQARINEKTTFRIGLSGHRFKRTLDWSKLSFGDQIDPRYGFIYATSQKFGLEKVNGFKASGGLALLNERYLIAYAMNNFNTPNQGFVNRSSLLPIRHTINLSYLFLENDNSGLIANVTVEKQEDFDLLFMSVNYYWHWLRVGAANRYKDASIGMIGTQFKNYRISYLYEYTVSRLTNASAGSHEVQFSWTLQSKMDSDRKCPKVLWNSF